MTQQFAVAFAHAAAGWAGAQVELAEIGDLDDLSDRVRDRLEEHGEGGPGVLFVEEDDEYAAIVRVEGVGDARVFLSDQRAALLSPLAALLMEQGEGASLDDPDEGEGEGEDAKPPRFEPVGDPALLADVGVPAQFLLDLCAEEGMLPADIISGVCERMGCLDELEEIREGL